MKFSLIVLLIALFFAGCTIKSSCDGVEMKWIWDDEKSSADCNQSVKTK